MFIIPEPLVSVRNWFLKPIKPLEGISNSKITLPNPLLTKLVIFPFLMERFLVTVPTNSSGISIKTFSTGSCVDPSISFVITSGREAINSYPSRLMVSIRTAIWSSPLPFTSKTSVLSVFDTCKDTLLNTSFSNLSIKFLDVTYLPSLPANGELFTLKNIETVGWSIEILSSGIGFSLSDIVSPIFIFSKPATAIISPDSSISTLFFSNPLKVYKAENFWLLKMLSSVHKLYCLLISNIPLSSLPIAIWPTYGSYAKFVIKNWVVPSSEVLGPSKYWTINLNSGSKFVDSSPMLCIAIPSFALVYIMGNSICSSLASKSINKS